LQIAINVAVHAMRSFLTFRDFEQKVQNSPLLTQDWLRKQS
jgi:hypothetical protein